MLALTLWFVPAFALLVGLGVWQLQRLDWKEALIAHMDARMHAPTVPLDEALRNGLEGAEWRHVSVSGQFQHDKEVYEFAQGPEDAVGVRVITPFVQNNGQTILIDRGFASQDRKDPATRAQGQVAEPTHISGVARLTQQVSSYFTPAPSMKERMFFARDIPAMAAMAWVALSAPIVIEADAVPNPGGWPVGGQTQVEIPNNHLQYAFTWFALALVAAVFYLLYHRKQGRLDFS